MKNTSVVLLLILMLGISTGCDKDFLNHEEITDIYYANKELINNIKDGLLSSGFIPHDGMIESRYHSYLYNDIILRYDYKNGKLICSSSGDNPMTPDEKLQSIQSVHSDVIEYFKRMNKNYNPNINFRKSEFMEDVVIEFGCYKPKRKFGVVGIIYTTEPEKVPFGGLVHIEDNWYTYMSGVV